MSQPATAMPLLLAFTPDLADLLRPRRCLVRYPLDRRASIKDIIESLDIPHTEIGEILDSNGRPLDFAYLPQSGDRLTVRGPQAPVRLSTPTLLRPATLSEARFLADANVARLGRLLRLVGLDTAVVTDEADEAIAERAAAEKRILLSRDRDLLKRRIVQHGRLVRAAEPYRQLVEIVTLYGLSSHLAPFSRCAACNTLLEPVDKATVLHRLEPLTSRYYHTFTRCPRCERIYWPGSHRDRLRARLAQAGIRI